MVQMSLLVRSDFDLKNRYFSLEFRIDSGKLNKISCHMLRGQLYCWNAKLNTCLGIKAAIFKLKKKKSLVFLLEQNQRLSLGLFTPLLLCVRIEAILICLEQDI